MSNTLEVRCVSVALMFTNCPAYRFICTQDGRVTVDEETRLHHIMSEAVYNGVVAAYTTIPKYSLQGPFYTHAKHAAVCKAYA
jgi:hypothetical protein